MYICNPMHILTIIYPTAEKRIKCKQFKECEVIRKMRAVQFECLGFRHWIVECPFFNVEYSVNIKFIAKLCPAEVCLTYTFLVTL